MTRKACLFGAVAVALVLAPLAARADTCDAPRNQLEMNQCATARYAAADKVLNQRYADYRKRLSAIQAKQLKQAQTAWIKFRDASCAFESSGAEKGSAHPVVYQSCLAAKTQERVKQLETLASCQEGDLSCPAPK